MKCDYCSAEDHLITACPTKKGHRAFDLTSSCLLAILLFPFFIIGALIGLCAGALVGGYSLCFGAWKLIIKKIKGSDSESTEI